MMEKSYFDGRSFEDLGIVVERVHDDLPAMREEMEQKPGGHGSHVNSLTLEPREIPLECRYLGDRWADFDSIKDELAAWLVTRDDRVLQLRNHPGQHYLAHYKSLTEGERWGGTGVGGFEVAFTASDPIRFGEERSFVLKGDEGQKWIEVGGTERADMTISTIGVRRGSSDGTWGITVGGSTLRVAITSGGFHKVSFDCSTHRATIDEKVTGVTLDSEWPDFAPGRWRCEIDNGMGTATFSWVQRYR